MADIWDRKYQEFGARCAYCGKSLFSDVDAYMSAVLDHIVPRKTKIDDSDGNKALSCATCNTLKGDFDPTEGTLGRTKEQLIERSRQRVFEQRANKVREFADYLKKYEKGKR